MTAEVEVLPQATFNTWLATRARGAGLGEETYNGVCAKCHGLQGQGDIGPKLAGNGLLNDAAGIERLLRNGKNTMPPVGKDWGDTQMKAITDYLAKEIVGG
jgi:mono/diheme cytochrome c family protein